MGENMRKWNRDSFKAFLSAMLLLLASSAGLFGCSGRVYTVTPPQGIVPEDISYKHVTPETKCTLKGNEAVPSPCKFEGVLAYPQDNFTEIYWTTSVLEEVKAADGSKKKIVLKTYDSKDPDKQCTPRIETKLVVRTDYSKPYQLFYSPGLLEKYIFKTEFDSGVLKSVNTESTPDRGETIKNIATAVKEFTEAAKTAATPMFTQPSPETGSNVTRCTDEPLLKYIVKTSDLCQNNKQCDFKNYKP